MRILKEQPDQEKLKKFLYKIITKDYWFARSWFSSGQFKPTVISKGSKDEYTIRECRWMVMGDLGDWGDKIYDSYIEDILNNLATTSIKLLSKYDDEDNSGHWNSSMVDFSNNDIKVLPRSNGELIENVLKEELNQEKLKEIGIIKESIDENKLKTILDKHFRVVKTGNSYQPYKIYSKLSNMFGNNKHEVDIGNVGITRFLEDRFDKRKIDIPKFINNYIREKLKYTDIIKEQVNPKIKDRIYSLLDDNFEFRKTNGGGIYFDVYNKIGNNKISFSTIIDFIADRVGTYYEASRIIDNYLVNRFPDYYKTWRTKKSIVKENIIGNDKIEAKIKKLIDANFEFKKFFDINKTTLPGIIVYKKDNNLITSPNEIETFIKDRISSEDEKIKMFIQRYVGQKLARNEIEDLNESIGSEKLEYKIKKLLDKNFDFIFKHGLYIVNPKGSNNIGIENSLSDDDIEDFIVDRIGEIHRKEIMKFIYKYLLEKQSDSKKINEEISDRTIDKVLKKLTDKYYVKLIHQIQFIFDRETNKSVLNGDVVLWNWIVDMIGETDEGMDLADKIYDEFIRVSLNENLIKEEIDHLKILDKVIKKLDIRFGLENYDEGFYDIRDKNRDIIVPRKAVINYIYLLLGDVTEDALVYIMTKWFDSHKISK